MPLLGDSLSDYVSPDYDIDKFDTYRDGKSRSNYIHASAFNKLASSLYAAQQKCLVFEAAYSGDFDVTKNLHFDETGSTGTCDPDPLINNFINSEYYYGTKQYNSAQIEKVTNGSMDKFDPNNGSGPVGLTSTYNTGDMRIQGYVIAPTPLAPRGTWIPVPNYVLEGNLQRVIIGSGRGQMIGTQYRQNFEVYSLNNGLPQPPALSGTPLDTKYMFPVPSGYVGTNKDILGPGALFATGTFWVPDYRSWGLAANNGKYWNKFAWQPGANCSPRYARLAEGKYWAHVLVFGAKDT